ETFAITRSAVANALASYEVVTATVRSSAPRADSTPQGESSIATQSRPAIGVGASDDSFAIVARYGSGAGLLAAVSPAATMTTNRDGRPMRWSRGTISCRSAPGVIAIGPTAAARRIASPAPGNTPGR